MIYVKAICLILLALVLDIYQERFELRKLLFLPHVYVSCNRKLGFSAAFPEMGFENLFGIDFPLHSSYNNANLSQSNECLSLKKGKAKKQGNMKKYST